VVRNGQGNRTRKVIMGTQPLWPVVFAEPLAGAPPAPTIIFAGQPAVPLTRVRDDDAMDGIDTRRTRLTASGGGLAALHQGMQGVDYGAAFIITKLDGWFPVQIQRIEDGAIELAEPLPQGVVISVAYPATVQYATWTATVPAAVSAAETGRTPISWSVEVITTYGAHVPNQPAQVITGLVHVVKRMFATGLTHHRFLQVMRGMHSMGVYSRQRDWTPQIDTALLKLISYLRPRIPSTATRREDDLDGSGFELAHAYFTAALIHASDEEEHDRLFRLASIEVKDVLESVPEDFDGDDQHEISDQGKRATHLFGGGFAGTDPNNPTAAAWIGEAH